MYKTIFRRDIQLYGQPVRLLGAPRPTVQNVTELGFAPEPSPPPIPADPTQHAPGFTPPAYPGKSPFGSSCPVCH